MANQEVIHIHSVGDPDLELKSDLAAEFPIYLYFRSGAKQAFYSTSIKNLLADQRIQKPLTVCDRGLSFLLQCGVVPPPKTIFKDIYVIGMGVCATLKSKSEKIELEFKTEFPFRNDINTSTDDVQPDEDLILQILAESTLARIDNTAPSYLFHSAGKDSNMLALALAEAGCQNQIVLVTHESTGVRNESGYSQAIAKKLGFKHVILKQDLDYKNCFTDIQKYFENVTIPVVDVVTLAYPSYTSQLPSLQHSNCIDGGGNDCYMGTPPSQREMRMFAASRILAKFRSCVERYGNSASLLNSLTRSKAEWCGFSGFLYADVQKIFPQGSDVRSFFSQLDAERSGWDDFDFKTSVLTTNIAAEMHVRKLRTAADYWNANAILPFANERLAKYFSELPEKYRFCRKTLKNKLLFRKILKERIGLDSDVIGKLGYHFDFWRVLQSLPEAVEEEILLCPLWQRESVIELMQRLSLAAVVKSQTAWRARNLLLRLYLISAWVNQNLYLKPVETRFGSNN